MEATTNVASDVLHSTDHSKLYTSARADRETCPFEQRGRCVKEPLHDSASHAVGVSDGGGDVRIPGNFNPLAPSGSAIAS